MRRFHKRCAVNSIATLVRDRLKKDDPKIKKPTLSLYFVSIRLFNLYI